MSYIDDFIKDNRLLIQDVASSHNPDNIEKLLREAFSTFTEYKVDAGMGISRTVYSLPAARELAKKYMKSTERDIAIYALIELQHLEESDDE